MQAPRTAQAFPPSARLLRPAQFAAALKGRRIGRSDWLILTTPRTATQQPRLGLIIAKRYAKQAVTRNTIKRVLREAFRHQQRTLPPHDYVFRLHSRIQDLPLTHIKENARSQADALLHRARKMLNASCEQQAQRSS